MTTTTPLPYYSLALSDPATPVSPAETRAAAEASHRGYLWKKLHSLTGVVPLGVFLVEHLWTNAKALQGADAFTGAVADIQALPYLPFIEVFGIFLPLAYHSFYGLYLAVRGRQNALVYTYAKNWLYVLQRVSGVLTFVFITYHLAEFRLQKLLHGMQSDAFYQALEAHLSSTRWGVPWLALFYLLGIASTVFHFANGLSGFCISWGITVTRAAQRRASLACAALGVILFFLGANTVVFFATGTRLYPRGEAPSAVRAEALACPAMSHATPNP